ncbi:hypothetical protein N9003_01085 [bacterium]|nr:hypothetical protein [bacterium]
MDNNFKPNHIEDYLISLHTGSWFSWTNSNDRIYKNLILTEKVWDKILQDVIDNPYSLPTEAECIEGLTVLQTNWDNEKTNAEAKKASGKQKLKDLGLDDAEIKALIG